MFTAQIQRVIDEVDALREKVSDHWQLPVDEAKVLAQLVRIGGCKSVCEIGTSYGFSALHLAAATRDFGGHVHTIDVDPKKIDAATRHLQAAGLSGTVTPHLGRAQDVLAKLRPQQPFDFVFIDAWKEQSREYLDAVGPHLARRAVIVTDNTSTHWDELADFVHYLRQLPNATSCGVTVGNGFELTVINSGS
jgi:predicted O-methyltransferase YrrM